MTVRWSEHHTPHDGTTPSPAPTWDRLGARIHAAAILAATLHLARRAGQHPDAALDLLVPSPRRPGA